MLSQLIARVNLIQMIYLFNKFPGDAFHNGPFSRRSSAEVSRASSPTICLSTPKLSLPMLIPSTPQPTLRRSEAPAKRSRVSPGEPATPRLLRPGGPPTLPRANVQSSVQSRGPGLGAENLHPPRSLAPPAGSLYASATTEKNRCRHLREDLPPEIMAVTPLSLFLSFQALSAVWRILSHWEWVPSCNVRAADPCYRPLPRRPAASSQLGVCKDRGSPRRGRRSSSSFSYPERNKRAGRRGVGPSAPPGATSPALWAPRAVDVAAPPPSFRGSGGSRPCLPTRSRRLPPGRPHYRLCTWKGPQAGFGETPSPGGSGVAGPSGSRGSA